MSEDKWEHVDNTTVPEYWIELGNAYWKDLIYSTQWNGITYWRRYRGDDD